jgi:hypothetical protein
MSNNEMNQIDAKLDVSPEALAHLGDGRIAYVKTIRSEDVGELFPQVEVPPLQPGQILFALHGQCLEPGTRNGERALIRNSVIKNQ